MIRWTKLNNKKYIMYNNLKKHLDKNNIVVKSNFEKYMTGVYNMVWISPLTRN